MANPICYKPCVIKKTIELIFLQGTPCDLITGEERRHASLYSTITNPDEKKIDTPDDDNTLQLSATELTASNHVACTVEMTSLNNRCEWLHLFLL